MAKKLICDRCGKEHERGRFVEVTSHEEMFGEVYIGTRRFRRDLCEECADELYVWLNKEERKQEGADG